MITNWNEIKCFANLPKL